MGLRVLTAAARAGKTDWAICQVLDHSSGLDHIPYVLLPSKTQVNDFRSRLSNRGGAIGVFLGTFGDLTRSILDRSGRNFILISEISQHRLLQSILDDLDLTYFQKIKNKPGFTQSVLAIIRELEAGKILPDKFLMSGSEIDQNGRLLELAKIYQNYWNELLENNWVDPALQTWRASDLLKENPSICPEWDSIIVDGFDDLSPAQMDLIVKLSETLPQVTITVTGSENGGSRPLVHKRFLRLKQELIAAANVEEIFIGEKLRKLDRDIFDRLGEGLFSDGSSKPLDTSGKIEMAAVPDRENEVRTALRWIKIQISSDLIKPGQTALITRNLEPYREIIRKVAEEYRIPVMIMGGISLDQNPAIAAIMSVLRLAQTQKEGLFWRDVISVWNSPYLDWSCLSGGSLFGSTSLDRMRDIKYLADIAKWGSVIQGYQQWEDAFLKLIDMTIVDDKGSEPKALQKLPTGEEAAILWNKFNLFMEIISPPPDGKPVERYVHWIEKLLGDLNNDEDRNHGLNLYQQIILGEPDLAERDLQAIRKLSEIFRELIWAEAMVGSGNSTFENVLLDIEAELRRQSYQPHENSDQKVICADCTEIRGIGFKAVALMGLAEGEFPGLIKEDPFLREVDRAVLRDAYGLPLRSSIESAEAEFFYEAISRPIDKILITRPRVADNGTPWEPSPYWEELLRRLDIEPEVKTSRDVPALNQAATISEIFEAISTLDGNEKGIWVKKVVDVFPRYFQKISVASKILRVRSGRSDEDDKVFDGSLIHLAQDLKTRYPEEYVWSPSKLEKFQICPMYFFMESLLGLEKPEPPQEGLNARQLGNIYHHILEDLYLEVGENYDISLLFNLLPDISTRVFAEAPRKEGFRETAWWGHTQEEIKTNIQKSLIVLESINDSFRFYRAEQKFGIGNDSAPELVIELDGLGKYNLRGLIDRIDIDHQNQLRIIDYKTSSPIGFDNQSVRAGKKLQLPLYAVAAQNILQLGDVVEGFYFHVRSAKSSSFNLSKYWNDGNRGPQAAMENAKVKGWQAVDAIQNGRYSPKPPDSGCPEYCPAVDFCWKYKRQTW